MRVTIVLDVRDDGMLDAHGVAEAVLDGALIPYHIERVSCGLPESAEALVDAVAEALWNEDCWDPDERPFSKSDDWDQRYWRDEARAAIAVMREYYGDTR